MEVRCVVCELLRFNLEVLRLPLEFILSMQLSLLLIEFKVFLRAYILKLS